MSLTFALGIFYAILCGAMNAIGVLCQKKAVNRIVGRGAAAPFFSSLLRSPLWLAGLFINVVLGSILNILAQGSIGPALVPGLTASGLIFLALGSTKILREKQTSREWAGIAVLVTGITVLGFSNLAIARNEVDILNTETQYRLYGFTLLLLLCWGATWLIAKKGKATTRGLVHAVSSGFPFSISNLWVLPLLLTAAPILSGTAQTEHIVLFIAALAILVGVNVGAIRQTQEAYRTAPANKAMPLQAVPVQIIPILIFFFVFQKPYPHVTLLLAPLGVALILIGGFLLAGTQESK